MTILTDTGVRKAGFIVSEANDWRSRDEGTLTVGADETIVAGTILGKITASGNYIAQLAAAIDGSEAPAAILYADASGNSEDLSVTVVARDAEVNGAELTYDPAADAAAITTANADLAAVGIIVR